MIHQHPIGADGHADVAGVRRAQSVSVKHARRATEIEADAVVVVHDLCAIARASSRNSRRRILPTADFGRLSRNSISTGRLNSARFAMQWLRNSSVLMRAPGLGTINAFTTSPKYRSGTPMTTVSITPGYAKRTASTSDG